MDDKFILMGLGDENSKDIAEIMKSKTAKKIIDFLADRKEASEKEIADNLGMPLNTIEYNLNKLVKASLVKKSDKIYWSEKGKRIEMYQMARKHIIISSDNKPSLSYLKSILPFVAVFAIIIALIIGMGLNKESINKDGGDINRVIGGIEKSEKIKGLKSFSSYDELKEFLKKNADEKRDYGLAENFAGITSTMPSVAKADSSDSSVISAEASDYSTTNIQVEGVDEPDIVKNDGKYIYIVSGDYGANKVVIVEAFPPEDMEIVKEINLNRNINQIFLNGNKLIVFSQSYEEFGLEDDNGIPVIDDVETKAIESKRIASDSAIGIWPGPRDYRREKTHIDIFDISDRENPELEDSYSVSGNYRDARMIGDFVYLISNEHANYNYPMPMYEVNGVAKEMPINNIYYFDYAGSYTFTSISALDLDNGDFESEIYLMDNSGNIYVSENNIYLTYQKYMDYRTRTERIIEEGIINVLPESEKNKAEEIIASNRDIYDKHNLIYKIATDYSQGLKGKEKSDFDKSLRDSLQDVEDKINKEYMKTVVNKIGIDKENIEYKGKGEVYGTALNQFSMDEYKGNFRIATTTGNVWGGNNENNIYVLDKDLKVIGKLEDLGKEERIYSARFIGERAYLVTFKKIDPFFVIDLSDEENPRVLGYLKIPGYSDYLHPYDEDNIIGIGKDTAEPTEEESAGRENDFAWYQGLKISLFDVSNVESPKEQAKIVIGERGTDSNALYDHKAFLFDKKKGILVLPVRLAKVNEQNYIKQYGKVPSWAYGDIVWQGAYVFDINKGEIKVRGKVTHQNVDVNRYYNWGYEVERSLYMDDVLYTISKARIKANDLDNIEEISEIKLPFKEDYLGGVLY